MRSTTAAVSELGTILSIWAHPDDETYLAGGVMAAARDAGQRVVCVSATSGERGTSEPDRWPPHRLAPVRRWEVAAAMAVLGVDEHHVLGLPDGELAGEDVAAVERVGWMIDRVRPDTIVTFGADGVTRHPDHIAVHRWVTRAWTQRGRTARLLYATMTTEFLARYGAMLEDWNVYIGDERPRAVPRDDVDLCVELQGAELDRKVVALRAMATQTGAVVAGMGVGPFAAHVAEECFVDAAGANGGSDGAGLSGVAGVARS